MPAGLIIYNDHGTILIDENYTNMSVVSSGMVTTADVGITEETKYAATLPFMPAAGEKIALRSSLYCMVQGNEVVASGEGIVYWYRFGAPVMSNNNAGLRIFNAAGQLTFDSGRQCARVSGSVSGSIYTPSSQTFTPGRVYAVIQGRRGVRCTRKRYNDGFGNLYFAKTFRSTASRVNGASIEWSEVVSHFYVSDNPEWASPNYSAYVVDVTGY